MRLVTLGVGAQNSPRYAPAGLLVAHGGVRVMIDGGPRAVPPARLDAWLVTDPRGELIAAIRRLAERPIRFAGGVGGHLDLQAVARAARRHGVRRLVFAHIGRPTLRALDRGLRPAFGEFATDRQAFLPGRRHRLTRSRRARPRPPPAPR